MCRWMAYSGDPILVEDLLFRPKHSLIDQSLHSRLGATTTNGDGFGIGWYGDGPVPALFKSVDPAWNDQNLREIASQVRTPLFFAHVRASTGTPVQRTNCHPFRHGRWLWMHNGALRGFHETKRELLRGRRPVAVSRHRGLHRLGGAVLPGADVRLDRRPVHRSRRVRSGSWRRSAATTGSTIRCR